MALSEYETRVLESFKEQWATSNDYKEWLDKYRTSKELDQSVGSIQETRQKLTWPWLAQKALWRDISFWGTETVQKWEEWFIWPVRPDVETTETTGLTQKGTFEQFSEAGAAFPKWAVETWKGIVEAAWQTFTWLANIWQKKVLDVANLIREKIGKEPLTIEEATQAWLDPTWWLQTTLSQDLLDIWQWSLSLWLTSYFPWTTLVLNSAAQTEGWEALLLPLTEAIAKGWEIINEVPWLKQFRESLPEEERVDFDAFTWQIALLWIWKSLKEIKAKYNQSKQVKLTKEAEWLVKEFVKPTKETTKTITKEITPEILERKITWTREQVWDIAKAGIETSWKAIEKFIEEWRVKWEMPISQLVDVLAKEDAALRFEWKILPWKEPQVKFIDKTLNFLEQLEKTKAWEKLTAEQQITLKRSFDTVFDKTITRDKITKFQDDLQVKLADNLRAEISKNNPSFAKLNKDYSFYKSLDTVMSETLLRETWQSVWLWTTVSWLQKWTLWAWLWATIWTTAAWPIWTIVWGALWAVTWAKLQSIISSPKWKLVSANKKANLAKTLAEWNPAKIETLLRSFAITLWLNED